MTWLCYIENRTIMRRIIMRLNCMYIVSKLIITRFTYNMVCFHGPKDSVIMSLTCTCNIHSKFFHHCANIPPYFQSVSKRFLQTCRNNKNLLKLKLSLLPTLSSSVIQPFYPFNSTTKMFVLIIKLLKFKHLYLI